MGLRRNWDRVATSPSHVPVGRRKSLVEPVSDVVTLASLSPAGTEESVRQVEVAALHEKRPGGRPPREFDKIGGMPPAHVDFGAGHCQEWLAKLGFASTAYYHVRSENPRHCAHDVWPDCQVTSSCVYVWCIMSRSLRNDSPRARGFQYMMYMYRPNTIRRK